MDFERAVQALCDAEVEFVIVGGLAAVFCGAETVSYVLEVCYSRKQPNLARLKQALAPYHPRPRGFSDHPTVYWDETILQNDSLLKLTTDLLQHGLPRGCGADQPGTPLDAGPSESPTFAGAIGAHPKPYAGDFRPAVFLAGANGGTYKNALEFNPH